MSEPAFTLRPCVPSDAETLVNLVRALAVYERLEAFVVATPDDFRRHLFGPHSAAEAILAEVGGRPVGFALYFTSFSTFRGRPGFYLEDLFVEPEHRDRGIGKALLAEVARRAVERGCGRLEWSVLNWNAPSIGFYRSLGARPMDEWTVYRVDDQTLLDLARHAAPAPDPAPSEDGPRDG